MKSPMVEQASYITPEDKGRYSDLVVLASGAGYYVGTIYHNPNGFVEPGSRDSDYFMTQEAAFECLQDIEAGKYKTRMEP